MKYDLNLDAIISQRLKLATQDLKNADCPTVLTRVIDQDRRLSDEEIQQEVQQVERLCAKSKATVSRLGDNKMGFFSEKIKSMNLSKNEMMAWTSQTARQVLAFNASTEVAPGGFIPEPLYLELQQVVAAHGSNTETPITEDRLTELQIYCLNMLTLLCFKNPALDNGKEPVLDFAEDSATVSLAEKALVTLRSNGMLSEHWEKIPDDQIGEVLRIASHDNTARGSAESVLDALTQFYVLEFAKTRADENQPVYEMDDQDLQARNMLSIAVIRNLKATGKLPRELDALNEEDLALAAYCGSELNFYFDEAAAGKITLNTFLEMALPLACALFFVFLAALFLTEPADPRFVITGIFFALCAVYYVSMAVDVFLRDAFPAGVGETRLGIAVRATTSQICTFVDKLRSWIFEKLSSTNNPTEIIGETENESDREDVAENEDEEEDVYEDEYQEMEE